MNRDYDFTGIEQAARYSKLEHMRPGGISEWSKEAKYMVLLFETNRARKGWGISEGVYVDVRCDVPYYIVTQYDGQIAAQTWYLDKDELTFDQVREYMRDESEELYEKLKGISASNWREYVKDNGRTSQ